VNQVPGMNSDFSNHQSPNQVVTKENQYSNDQNISGESSPNK